MGSVFGPKSRPKALVFENLGIRVSSQQFLSRLAFPTLKTAIELFKDKSIRCKDVAITQD